MYILLPMAAIALRSDSSVSSSSERKRSIRKRFLLCSGRTSESERHPSEYVDRFAGIDHEDVGAVGSVHKTGGFWQLVFRKLNALKKSWGFLYQVVLGRS